MLQNPPPYNLQRPKSLKKPNFFNLFSRSIWSDLLSGGYSEMGRGNKAFEVPNKRQVTPETTNLDKKSSLCFIPTQVLLSKGKANQTKSSPTKASHNGTTIEKEEEEKVVTDSAKTEEERGTMKNWSPSMDGIMRGDIPPYLTYCMKVFLGMDDDEIIEKVLYGSSKSNLHVFEELCSREKDIETKCDKEQVCSREKDIETKWDEDEDDDYVFV